MFFPNSCPSPKLFKCFSQDSENSSPNLKIANSRSFPQMKHHHPIIPSIIQKSSPRFRILGHPTTLQTAQCRITIPVALASAIFNNGPLVAMLVPVVQAWALRHGHHAAQLLKLEKGRKDFCKRWISWIFSDLGFLWFLTMF